MGPTKEEEELLLSYNALGLGSIEASLVKLGNRLGLAKLALGHLASTLPFP